MWIDRAAKKFTELGFVCVSLTYRTPRPQGLPIYQSAWEDGQRAVRLVRSEAKTRGFDPEKIGAFGFSAGSHLTVLLATSALTPAYGPVDALDQLPCHLNWAVPIYTAYALTDGLAGPNTREGDVIDAKLSDVFKFDAKTCPMALFHGGADIYSPNGSTQIYRQLRRMKIPAEIHLFADRPHGFMGDPNKGEDGTAYDHWLDRIAEYLRQMNFDGRLGAEVDLMARYPNDEARGDTRKEPIWPEGKMPDVQTNQGLPYLEWHMPKELKTKAIQIIYSGGGHLTLMGATSSKRRAYWPIDDLDKLPCNVQWAVAICPAYALTDGAENPNEKGGNEDDARLVPEFSFDLATCPVLFIHGDADGWAAMNSVTCWEQLRRMGIQSDLHTLVGRPHCFQRKAAPGTGSYTWMGRIWEFMNHKGFNK
ncbi:MAG: alpha/beta hydrolase [Kiritimatiellae bacterium]|nr:alpha/beta hydrolase [Kiritimatiellia bacterium]